MSHEDVDAAIIRPMLRLFPAPRHLRMDEDAFDEALALYRQALARFERPVLELAWQRTAERNALWCWPKLADLITAAEQAQRQLPSAGTAAWVEEATTNTEGYLRRYLKTSPHALRAREGGYEPHLKRYVREAAWVQAQLIAGQRHLGYDHAVLFGAGPRDHDAEEAFFDAARAQAQCGAIKVRVPSALLLRWREQAAAPACASPAR